MSDRQGFLLMCGAVVGVLFLVCGGCCVVPSVEPGHVGVVKSFGDMSDNPFPAGGPYLVRPWASVIRVNVQTQKNDEELSIPTKGGLTVKMHAVLLYKVRPERAASLLRETANGKYEEVLVDPIFKSCVRDVCANHVPEDLYDGTARADIEYQILAKVQKELDPRGFACDAVMIQDPQLPGVVTERVQAKIAAEQDAIRMQSVYKQREQEAMANKRQKELEAEAKVIEAKGIADAQAIIQKDLSHEYLVYLWIEALRDCAKHNNATIYVPTGSDGMPMFQSVKPPAKK